MIFAALAAAPHAYAECTVDDVTVTLTRAKWVNTCRTQECWSLRGTGVLEQRCSDRSVIMLRLTGYDPKGVPVVTNEVAPFGVRAVRPGTHPFSIDHLLDYEPDAVAFGVEVVEVRGPVE